LRERSAAATRQTAEHQRRAAAARADSPEGRAVAVSLCQRAYVWAGGPIPAILDGEPIQLGRTAMARFNPDAFRALVPADRETP
jgi:diacylglycerol kinase family enzyme